MGSVAFPCVVLVACLVLAGAEYRNDGFDFRGFVPSFQRTEDQLAEPSARVEKSRDEKDNQADRTQRFGISTYGSTGGRFFSHGHGIRSIHCDDDGRHLIMYRGQHIKLTQAVQFSTLIQNNKIHVRLGGGFGSTAPGLYGPVKIDLGGVLIGSLLGFGAVIILPKIIHALSYSYGGGYGRSLETDFSQVSDMFGKIDEMLSRYNVDSTACMQRLACSYVQLANENMVSGNATEFDALLSSLSDNTLVRRMLDGTAVFEAVSAGRSADSDCHALYQKCKLDKKTVVKMLTQLVPS